MARMDSTESLFILITSYKHSSQDNKKYLGSSFSLHSDKYNNIAENQSLRLQEEMSHSSNVIH